MSNRNYFANLVDFGVDQLIDVPAVVSDHYFCRGEQLAAHKVVDNRGGGLEDFEYSLSDDLHVLLLQLEADVCVEVGVLVRMLL